MKSNWEGEREGRRSQLHEREREREREREILCDLQAIACALSGNQAYMYMYLYWCVEHIYVGKIIIINNTVKCTVHSGLKFGSFNYPFNAKNGLQFSLHLS